MTDKQHACGVDEGLFYSLQKKETFAKKMAAYTTFANSIIEKTSPLSTRNAIITTPRHLDKMNRFNPYANTYPSETAEEKSEQPEPTQVQPPTKNLEALAETTPAVPVQEITAQPPTIVETPAEKYTAPKEPEKTYEQPAQEAPTTEYVNLGDITKIPGTKPLAMINNVALPAFRKDHPELWVEHREARARKITYAAVEKLFEYILKDPTKASESVQNYKKSIKETEKAALTSLVDQLIESSDVAWSIEELCKLPGIRSYHMLKNELSDYAREHPKNKKTELKKSTDPAGTSTHENKYKLTKKLVAKIFKDPEVVKEITYWFDEKNKPKKKIEQPKTETIEDKLTHYHLGLNDEPTREINDDAGEDFTEQAILQAFTPLPQPYIALPQPYIAPPTPPDQHPPVTETKSKKQLKREQEDLRKEEIRRDIVRKLIDSKKIGGNCTPIENLPKGLSPHEKGLAKEVIKALFRDDTLLRPDRGRTSINPHKLAELRLYLARGN